MRENGDETNPRPGFPAGGKENTLVGWDSCRLMASGVTSYAMTSSTQDGRTGNLRLAPSRKGRAAQIAHSVHPPGGQEAGAVMI